MTAALALNKNVWVTRGSPTSGAGGAASPPTLCGPSSTTQTRHHQRATPRSLWSKPTSRTSLTSGRMVSPRELDDVRPMTVHRVWWILHNGHLCVILGNLDGSGNTWTCHRWHADMWQMTRPCVTDDTWTCQRHWLRLQSSAICNSWTCHRWHTDVPETLAQMSVICNRISTPLLITKTNVIPKNCKCGNVDKTRLFNVNHCHCRVFSRNRLMWLTPLGNIFWSVMYTAVVPHDLLNWTILLFACCWVLRPASSQVSLTAATVTATYCESQVHARLCIVVVQIF